MSTFESGSQAEAGNPAVDVLLRRRAAFRGKPNTDRDVAQAKAEILVLSKFGREVAEADLVPLGRSLQLIPRDLSGRAVRVTQRPILPFRTWSRTLKDADVHIFVNMTKVLPEISGWLPVPRVREAPMFWWEKGSPREDYAHEVTPGFLNPLPKKFNFEEDCPHGEKYGAVWKDTTESWECFGCGRLVYDAWTRERTAMDNSRSDQVSQNPQGPEREGTVSGGGA